MTSADEAKACCAASYGNDAVALVLGESYHPVGLALTRRLAECLRLRTGHRVVDVASGPGATARMLATEYDVDVDGVDLGESTVANAREATAEAGLSAKVRFHVGDAERIPLPDAAFDALVCECAFCTFPDKATAAAEFARVLRPGGRVGITDVTITDAGLPDCCAALKMPMKQAFTVPTTIPAKRVRHRRGARRRRHGAELMRERPRRV
ncbi:MAG: methyltransferase domain-containing protein, partial [Actinophytocola sp.]|nr:methyltransferase domain-containing protein [Actinophytocola sp.]